VALTRRINGAMNGLAVRQAHFARAKRGGPLAGARRTVGGSKRLRDVLLTLASLIV